MGPGLWRRGGWVAASRGEGAPAPAPAFRQLRAFRPSPTRPVTLSGNDISFLSQWEMSGLGRMQSGPCCATLSTSPSIEISAQIDISTFGKRIVALGCDLSSSSSSPAEQSGGEAGDREEENRERDGVPVEGASVVVRCRRSNGFGGGVLPPLQGPPGRPRRHHPPGESAASV